MLNLKLLLRLKILAKNAAFGKPWKRYASFDQNTIKSIYSKNDFEFRIFEIRIKKESMYKTIEIDRDNLTLMGIQFPTIESLESTADALGTNMFEGFEPTKEIIQLYLNWKTGKILEKEFLSQLYSIYGK